MNKIIKFGLPSVLLAAGVLMGCKKSEPMTMDKWANNRIEVEYGSIDKFNEQRKALGIDPAFDNARALLMMDSINVAPIYEKYGLKQTAIDASPEEKLNGIKTAIQVLQKQNEECQNKLDSLGNKLQTFTKSL